MADNKPLRATLYELDGYTEYLKPKSDDMAILKPKRAYKLKLRTSEADGTEIYDGENYPGFPIIPLKTASRPTASYRGDRIPLTRSTLQAPTW